MVISEISGRPRNRKSGIANFAQVINPCVPNYLSCANKTRSSGNGTLSKFSSVTKYNTTKLKIMTCIMITITSKGFYVDSVNP